MFISNTIYFLPTINIGSLFYLAGNPIMMSSFIFSRQQWKQGQLILDIQNLHLWREISRVEPMLVAASSILVKYMASLNALNFQVENKVNLNDSWIRIYR